MMSAIDSDQTVEEFVLTYRLVQAGVNQRDYGARQAVAAGRGDQNQFDVAKGRIGTDTLGQIVAGHARHHLVQECDIVGLATVPAALKFCHRGKAIFYGLDLDTEDAKLPSKISGFICTSSTTRTRKFLSVAGSPFMSGN